MLVSILIPAYNVEKYLARCLDSVIKQVNQDCEIIIFNDGSTDKTTYIASQYSGLYSNVKLIISEKNVGVAQARNILLAHSSGEYIWFIDADDSITSNAYETIYLSLKKYPFIDIVMTSYTRINELNKEKIINEYGCKNDYLISVDTSFLLLFIKRRVNCYMCNKIIKRDFFNGLCFPSGKFYEDAFIFPKVLTKVRKILYINKPIYNYFYRTDSITASDDLNKIQDLMNAWQDNFFFFKRDKFPDKVCSEILYRIFRQYISELDKLKGSKISYEEYQIRKTALRKILENSMPLPINRCLLSFIKQLWFWRVIKIIVRLI